MSDRRWRCTVEWNGEPGEARGWLVQNRKTKFTLGDVEDISPPSEAWITAARMRILARLLGGYPGQSSVEPNELRHWASVLENLAEDVAKESPREAKTSLFAELWCSDCVRNQCEGHPRPGWVARP